MSDPETAQLENVVAAFEAANPGITLATTRYAYDDFKPALLTSLAGGEAPDTARMDIAWVSEFADQDALQQLTDLSVDAIITDLEMPRVNGYALIEDLRRRPNTREVPIVVLTTRAGEKHVNVARRLGVRHYITKPVDEQTFIRLVESLTAGAPSETALSGARTS